MSRVEIVDQTLRDGQQSHWGMRMRAAHMLPIAPVIDRVGYHVVDFTGSSIFEVLVKDCREDPWETVRLMVEATPTTPLRAGMRGNGIVGFSLTPHAILDLWIERLCANGVRSLWIYDVLHNVADQLRCAAIAKKNGAEVVAAIMFASSPAHSDDYFVDKARQLAADPSVDGIYFEDAPGVLTPERAARLFPKLMAVVGGKPVELHCHNTTGLAPLNYLEGIRHGANRIHTSVQPLANGPSMPSTEVMIANLDAEGHSHDLDTDLLQPIAEHFFEVARREGLPVGEVREYDARTYHHQIPGGMQGTLRNQLRAHGMEDRLPEVLEEAAQVRIDLGYPGMATPFSQLVGTQALINVTTGDRYSVVPDEVIIYVLGHLGQPPAPVDATVLDRICSSQRGIDFASWEPPQPTYEELRKRFPSHVTDDELILRLLMAPTDVDAMIAAGPVPRRLGDERLELVRELLSRPAQGALEVVHGSLKLKLTGATPPAGTH